MANSSNVTEGYDPYVTRVIRAGMNMHDRNASKIWRDCEPVVKDLTARHSYKVSKILVSILPCSVGEFYNRVMGLADGVNLGMSENLKKVEESMGAVVDNLQTRYQEMEKAQRYHDAQLLTLTAQVGHASSSISQSVKQIENLAVKMSEACLKLPLQSRAPIVVSESVGSSVFQPSRQDRSAPPEVSNPMRLGLAATLREERLKEKSQKVERSKVSKIDKDGSYRLHKIIVRTQEGRISQIKGMKQTPPISLFMGKKAELISPIFAHSPIAILDINEDNPGWWKCLEKGGSKAQARKIQANRTKGRRTFGLR